jgi:mannose-1-phosphate guanylyltransferase
MKAFLLSAGKGTRLRPITYHTPKCLVQINKRPLLDYWFRLFEKHGVNNVLINTSHLAEKVREYLKTNKCSINVRLTYEETLLGSGGTIKKNWDFVEDVECFYIIYSDNLTNIDLTRMLEFHRSNKGEFTLALTKVQNPNECGIVDLDDDLKVVSFQEKPENPPSDLAFAGIMISNRKLKDYFPDREVFDLGYDVLPNLTKVTSGYIMNEYLLDIGSPEKLKKAEGDVIKGIFKF